MTKIRDILNKKILSKKVKDKNNKNEKIQKERQWKIKKLIYGIKVKSGRNNTGKITMYHRGGGKKKRYRIVDFNRNLWNIWGKVKRIEYDPNRTAAIALIYYENGILSYILASEGMKIDYKIVAGNNIGAINAGCTLKLKEIPLGVVIHNIEVNFGKGGEIARAAGVWAQILRKKINYVIVKLSSGEERYILGECLATIGSVSKTWYKKKNLISAGANRKLNKRPRVRAAAMNPIDHPLGGRTRGGKIPVSAWGIKIGVKTKSKRSKKNRFIVKDRNNKILNY